MAKEWVLNNVMNRFQLNFKRNVGATSENIRKCKPTKLDDWKDYYYKNVKSENEIEELGKVLYDKIHSVIKKEISEISEEDCKAYMKELVINRTYDGYCNEISMIRDNLQEEINYPIEEAPDEWDRTYGVDFFIKINSRFIGIQIKPENIGTTLQVFARYTSFLKDQHDKFTKKYGGKCFIIFSVKEDKKKVIQNKEIVSEIIQEIQRLEKAN